MKLYIKHMVSPRCKSVVTAELGRLGIQGKVVDLGMAEVFGMTASERLTLQENLLKSGLELLDDRKSILVERIKNVITELIHYSRELPSQNYSDYISKKLQYDYTYLSNVFSSVKGMTIQQFIIINKVERVKELLLYNELNLTEISFNLHYSSVAHLSTQFKKVTGITPSNFKKVAPLRQQNLENL